MRPNSVADIFEAGTSYVGVGIVPSGLQVTLTTAPTSDQLAAVKQLEAHEATACAGYPLDQKTLPHVPISFRQVRYSWDALMAVNNRFTADQGRWEAAGVAVTAWGPDLTTDTVVVRLPKYSASVAAQLEKAYGPILTVSPQAFTAAPS